MRRDPRDRTRGHLLSTLLLAIAVLSLSASPYPVTALPVSVTEEAFTSRISSLNGRFLLLNMHGALFHSDLADLEEDIAYARWMNAGVVRVFATDNNTLKEWSGRQVGERIAEIAPVLRANQVKLIVTFVNNHRPVPGEPPESHGWMDGFQQLLLPFYAGNFRVAYLPFVRELISTVQAKGVLDVIFAWEFGNELHVTMNPGMIVPFMDEVAAEIRGIDPVTPLLPGTIGVEHMNPGNPFSPLGPWLACHAPVDAYTIHVYDWIDAERQGISRVSYDFDEVLGNPCVNGRRIPVLVEEIGTTRSIPGLYADGEDDKRVDQELRQLQYVLSRPGVIGVGPWSAESPRVRDRSYYDSTRGLTSYGPAADGAGSGYAGRPGPRARLEDILRNLPGLPQQSVVVQPEEVRPVD